MLTDFGTSCHWAAIKKATSQLELTWKALKSETQRNILEETILQIALDNHLVSLIAMFHLQSKPGIMLTDSRQLTNSHVIG